MLKIGIVGARDWTQEKQIEWFIKDLPQNVLVVSGGAKGVDSMAVNYAKKYGLATKEFLPDFSDLPVNANKIDYTKKYYERNQRIVDEVNFLVAFVNKDTGGTWDTIKRATKKKIPVKIFKPSLFIGYDEPLPEENLPAGKTSTIDFNITNENKGVYQIKRVSLGSYALNLKRNITPESWACFLSGKENCDPELIDKITNDFFEFFRKNKNFGKMDFLTVAPRSIRNLDKEHIMDKVLNQLSEKTGIPAVILFNPWDKKGRGRFATRSEISINPEIKNHINKNCFVLDDVVTTGYTLKSCLDTLTALEIHAHSLSWFLMA